ncbi:ABC transporter ATP-binding protein, partial [Clostridioides difficile]|nr:ABC transporter ATP-binding protein [Clostridioides difficile]
YMRPLEYLSLCGEITGLSKKEIQIRSEELLSLVGLGNEKRRIGGFSRGMKQRLGIAQALLSRPKLLICDEPTSALDPVGRKEILDIMLKIKDSTTVIFSTHILSDVERICDHVAILNKGSIALSGTLSEIKSMHGKDRLLLEFASNDEIQKFKSSDGIKSLLKDSEETNMEIVLHGKDIKAIQKTVISTLAEMNLCPVKMELIELSLENLFLEVVK